VQRVEDGNKGSGLAAVIKAMRNDCNTVDSGCRYDAPDELVLDSAVALHCSMTDSFMLLQAIPLHLDA
jgi:hypothetical protein